MIEFSILQGVIIIGGYILLTTTSGMVVNHLICFVSKKDIEKLDKKVRDTGFIIGKCENLLILTFMLLDAYTALALIFAAKAIVRREDLSKNSLFFVAGTMINFTYSILIALIVKLLMYVL